MNEFWFLILFCKAVLFHDIHPILDFQSNIEENGQKIKQMQLLLQQSQFDIEFAYFKWRTFSLSLLLRFSEDCYLFLHRTISRL